jgi:hypothetical protein
MLIERGDSGDLVAKLHQILLENGYDIGHDGADVFFGRDTYNAVCLFQGGHVDQAGKPLKIDGSVGDRTWWALGHPSGAEQLAPVAEPALQKLGPGFTIAAAAVAAARGEFAAGVKEDPNGSNRSERIDLYTGFTGKPPERKGPPWCAYAVSWCFAQNSRGKSPFGRIGNAQNIGLWAKKHDAALIPGVARAQPGDIFIIARDDIHGHCGIVEATPGSILVCLEGNSGNRWARREREISTITALVRIKD